MIATAELFDPAAQNFQTITTNLSSRAYHTATLLTDGRVFVACGVSGGEGRLGQKGSATSDGTGRFLIAPIGDGRCKFEIDGGSGNRPGKSYGVFFVGLDIVKGRTNVLPYYIWMTELDIPHAVKIPSPTASEFVVTTPLLRGLELRLPPGATIRDYDGNVVTEISITQIPLARPPFPLPRGVAVPFYFTIQPGGAYIQVPKDSPGPKGARLIYPNVGRAPAGARFNFWNYDYKEKGWYVYGLGTVTPDRRSVEPDPGVVLYEFTGAMVASSGLAPPFGPAPRRGGRRRGAQPMKSPPGSSGSGVPGSGSPGSGAPKSGQPNQPGQNPPPTGGDPVDLGTGLFVHEDTDFYLPDAIPLVLTRTYRQGDAQSRAFGVGTNHPYDVFLVGTSFPYTYQDLILADGSRVHYDRISPGTSYGDAVYEHTSSPTAFYKSRITWNGTGWNLTLQDGTLYAFPDSLGATTTAKAAVLKIQDRNGNVVNFTRDPSTANLTRITSPNGRWIAFAYDASNRITQASDNSGRACTYAYDDGGRLVAVTDAMGGVWRYGYDANNQMLTLQNPGGIVSLTNEYDLNGRVTRQVLADGSTYQLTYTQDASGNITQTDVTDARGFVRRVSFNTAGYFSGGYIVSDTYALARPEQQTTTYTRQTGSNLILSMTDPLSRTTTYSYDVMGNVSTLTLLAGTAEAVTTTYTYEPTFNQVASITDPLNHTTTFTYDIKGNLATTTDPLGNRTTITYNTAGQPISAADPLGNTTQLTYQSGDLTGVTNPLGRSSTAVTDSGGRLVSVTDPLGRVTRYAYDGLNRLTRVTDALGGVTTLAYDARGNLISVTDPRGSITSYAYDNTDMLTSRTDPLLRTESYQYDGGGNLTRFTDRKGQVTTYAYDGLNRLILFTFADTATVQYVYDAGDRLTQIVDSLSGAIARSYDNVDRLLSETTPQGSVSYTYDAADRRTTLTVAGQPAVNYTYDNGDRVTQITQGSSVVSLAYDATGRRISLTLPNAVVAQYTYDVASQITGITYSRGGSTLGNLTYQYDGNGQRVQTVGSLAQTNLPAPLTSATYNAANQLTQWGTPSLTYDLNGNLTGDGANTYAWDARSRLASMSGGVSATFQYDGLGRRIRNAAGTSFVYDAVNPVQELSGGTVTANLLTGLGVDEVFARADSGGTSSFLSDALGSTRGLVDATGTIQTQYSYEPFGASSTTGLASSNSFQYTGRKNDGTGLYYYRARYYSPGLYRFVSEDPLGLAAGMNLFTYALNSPTNLIDPSGRESKQSCNVSPESLNNYLQGTQLSGLGQPLFDAGGRYGVDPRLITAIAGAETSFGRNITRGQYNAWDWQYNGRNSPFTSWENGINRVTWGIGKGQYYFQDGRTDTTSLYNRYCLGPDCVNGLRNLNDFLKQQGGNPNALRFPCN